jgi:hypothetical protein
LGVGVVALFGVVASLVVAMSGSGAGAGSPEDAVRQFAGAVSDEDIVSAITMMPPSEVGSVHELYEPVIELLVRNDALDEDGNPLQGVDIEIADLQLETEDLADGITKVRITGGRVTLDIVAAELDEQIRQGSPYMEDVHEELDLADLDSLVAEANAELESLGADSGVEPGALSGVFLMTVREGDRWYVSPTYTLAEVAREALGLPAPEFGSWRDQVGPGAESPTEVVESYVGALSSLDSESLVDAIESGEPIPSLDIKGALAPGEFAAFFDYMPTFEAWVEETVGAEAFDDQQAAEAELADLLRDLSFDISADVEAEDRTIGDGRAKVVIRSARFELHATGRVDGEAVRVDAMVEVYDGTCADVSAEALVDGIVEPFEASECMDELPGTDFDGVFIVAIERDGGWYFSPTETLVEYARLAIDAALAA